MGVLRCLSSAPSSWPSHGSSSGGKVPETFTFGGSLLELISCCCCFTFYMLFCSPSFVSIDFCYFSLSLHFCFIAYHCSVFCSSILMMNNLIFYSFNFFILCYFILQILHIHCISLLYLTNIFLSVLESLIWCSCVRMHNILMGVLFLAYHKFHLFSLCLD